MNNNNRSLEKSKPAFRLLIINSSGNSTKTVTGKGFIRNRMQSPRYYTIGRINEEINDFERLLSSDRISKLHEALMWRKSVIVEIEVSGYERTINYMKEIKGSSGDYDAVLVPIINSSFKLIEDSIRTIDDLINVGVPSDKIRVLFNREPDSIECFDRITNKLDGLDIVYDLTAQINNHSCYQKLQESGLKYDDITESTLEANEEELKKLERLRAGERPSDLQWELVQLISLQRAVLASRQQHDEVFSTLFSNLIPG